jgi:hypothetical protein
MQRRFGRAPRAAVAVLAVAFVSLFAVATASAMVTDPTQVTGLTVTQGEGFATLAWTAVPGATDYQIERTPVDDANVPTGAAVIVGVWQPARHVNNGSPHFAESGFALGGRYQWRVRARIPVGTPPVSTPQAFSEPVFGTTRPQWGTGPGAGLRTGWETSGNATYTTDVQEWEYTAALDAASDRVRVVELGRTNPIPTGTNGAPGNRPINMFIIGYPTPLQTAAAISATPTQVFYCNVHGDEPQGRESCLIFARMLAFTEDPHILEILANTTVLIIPSSNPNGRARNQRGNETGADLNRDHAELLQPETVAFAKMMRDYTPEVGVDLHEGDSEDLPILSSRHLNVFESLFSEAKNGLVEGWMYNNAALSGWWHGPYSSGGDSHEGILRNTFGLKHAVGMLAENRPSGGTTRPAEGTQLANRNRKSYGSLYEEFQVLEYYWQRRAEIHAIVEASKAAARANVPPFRPFYEANGMPAFAVGKLVTRGSYPWPNFPPVGTGGNGPDTDAITLARTLVDQPCGYFVTEAQYSGNIGGPTLQTRLEAHGVAQQTRPAGHIVRLAQELRGLIPMLFDTSSVSPSPIVPGTRLTECPHLTAAPRTFSATLFDGQSQTDTLAIGNIATEVDEPLNWTITEAVSDCATPSDLPWVSASLASGSVPSAGGSTNVDVTLTTVGTASPAQLSGVLCLRSNDAGEALVTIPVSLELRSLLAELAAVRAAIAARGQTGVPKTDKAITHALAALDEATAAAGWTDGARLTQAGGRDVFDGSQKAVKELSSIAGAPAWATDAIKAITSLNREIAALAVSEAPAGQAKDTALRDLSRGDAEQAAGNYANAIVQYRRAWALVTGG